MVSAIDFTVPGVLLAAGGAAGWVAWALALQKLKRARVRLAANEAQLRDAESRSAGLESANGSLERERAEARSTLTALEENEQALRESEERFSKAFHSSPAISAITSFPDGEFLYVNETLLQAVQCERHELIGRTGVELGIWADAGVRAALVQRLEAGEAIHGQEYDVVDRHGGRHTLLGSLERIVVGGRRCILSINQDITERKQAETSRKRAERLRDEQNAVLEMIAQGAPLASTLSRLVLAIESQAPGMLCSILLLDKDGRRLLHCAAPSLPDEYNRAIHGIAIGPEVGSCGTAAFLRRPVMVENIETDPLWINFRETARSAGLWACWSTPICDAHQHVLGTFAIYYREPRAPDQRSHQLIATATHTAAICIKSAMDDALLQETARTLGRQNELLEHMGQLARIGAWSLDVKTRELTWSEQTYAIHEVDPTVKPEVETAIHFYAPEARPVIAAAVEAAMTSGTPWDLELPFISARGRRLWVRAQGQVELVDGKPVRVYGAFQDITERNRAAEVQRQLEVQLRHSQKMEAIGTLAGGVAHDFNNILGTIIACAELARLDSVNNPAALTSLNDLLKAGHRAKDLVKQILAFSRREEFERKVISLELVILESARLLRAALPSTIDLRTSLIRPVPSVLADSTLVQQVIVNLVTNAAHAIGSRPGAVEIIVRPYRETASGETKLPAAASGSHVMIQVRDNGCGIDDAFVERIFEPFFTTKGPSEGTGLGLSVVHGIVTAHGGVIRVESKPGEGSTFTVLLPASTATPPRPQEPALPSALPGGSEHLLIVDDEESLLKVTERVLRRAGYRVTACTTAAAALEQFVHSPDGFDLIVTDYSMPGRTGVDFARDVFAVRREMPIIICTGYSTAFTRDQALELGFCEFLHKPVESELLCRAIRTAIDRPTAASRKP